MNTVPTKSEDKKNGSSRKISQGAQISNLRRALKNLEKLQGCSRSSEVCLETKDQNTYRTEALTPKCCIANLSTMLIEIAQLFSRYEIPYWLDGGSLLGIVREEGLLAWDRDIDFGFHAQDEHRIFEALSSEGKPHRSPQGDIGFVLQSGLFYVPNWGRDYGDRPAQIPRIYYSATNHLYADIYPYYRTLPGKFGIGRIGSFTFDIKEENILNLEFLIWRGQKILIPSEPESFLSQRFGDDWMTPDPNFYQKYPPHSDELKAKLNVL